MPPHTRYFNADFDLALRPRPRQSDDAGLIRQVVELSAQAVLGARPGDAALVRVDLPQEFTDFLERQGLIVPRLLRHPDLDPQLPLHPFGWSAEAIELDRRCALPVAHPPLDVIRRVNGRCFSRRLEAEITGGPGPSAVVESVSGLVTFLAGADGSNGFVVKSEHGNAGLSNRRVHGPTLSATDRRFVEQRLAEDDRLVVEPWLQRERDWSVIFDVPFDEDRLRIHETFYTRDGAPIGALFSRQAEPAGHWSDRLTETARQVAGRLIDEGYSGPVCMDAFSYREGDRSELRPLVDLNCRRAMSDGAHDLWQQSAPERTVYYRFFNRRKLRLPSNLSGIIAALGSAAYRRSERRGILLASPLTVSDGGRSWKPGSSRFCWSPSHVRRLTRWNRGFASDSRLDVPIRLLVIVGPTASGKTRLGVQVAHRLGSEILSADSRQVYRGLDIGSGKDLDEYRQVTPAVPYHMIDVADPRTAYSVFLYQRDCYRLLDQGRGREPFRSGVPWVMVGGSGLYVEAVLRGYRIANVPENVELRQQLMQRPFADLLIELERLDPELARRTDRSSKKRVARALEIADFGRRHPVPVSDPPPGSIRAVVFGVELSPSELRIRIDARLAARLEQGMIQEVERLLSAGVPVARMAQLGLEYREVTEHLTGVKSEERMIGDLRKGILRLAKRQLSWFRGMPRRGTELTWIVPGDLEAVFAHQAVRRMVENPADGST